MTQTHAYLFANREQIFKCKAKKYNSPDDSDDSMRSVWREGGGDGRHFLRGGHIPEGAKFWFESASMHEVDAGEFHMCVRIYVEGDFRVSVKKFWSEEPPTGSTQMLRGR
jgi:hypothetical protein